MLHHTYTTPGRKALTITVFNFVSKAQFPLEIDVGNDSCYRPRVEFHQSTMDLTTPVFMECGLPKIFALDVS